MYRFDIMNFLLIMKLFLPRVQFLFTYYKQYNLFKTKFVEISGN